jgi:hypothetical protein
MSDQTTPTPTADQIAAFQRLDKILGDADLSFGDENWAEVRKWLPDSLTNRQPVLPNKPGWYLATNDQSPSGQIAIKLLGTGEWVDNTDSHYLKLSWVADHTPLTRLIPERPQVAMADLTDLISIYCKEADSSGMPINLARAILALANGTPA